MTTLDDIRLPFDTVVGFIEKLKIDATNHELYERLLKYEDVSFVATMNALITEKMDIVDTSPEFKGIMKDVLDSVVSTETPPSSTSEGKDKLMSLPRELSFILDDPLLDWSKREKKVEVSNLVTSLSNNLVDNSDVEDPYQVLDVTEDEQDFQKAATLYSLLKSFPNPEGTTEEDIRGVGVIELLAPSAIKDMDTTETKLELLKKFKKDVFTSGFKYNGDKVATYRDIKIILDETIKQKLEKVN